jgi:uncharacterized protein (TIGR02001 family)
MAWSIARIWCEAGRKNHRSMVRALPCLWEKQRFDAGMTSANRVSKAMRLSYFKPAMKEVAMKRNIQHLKLRHSMLLLAFSTVLVGSLAQAEEKKPDNEVTFNAAVASDYRFRGISQTRLKPAVQGGVDYVNNPTGLYAGAWASNIKWIKDGGGDGNIEIDVYGGKRGELAKGVSYDVGAIAYWYPSASLKPNPNTFEIYGQLGYGPAYLKYSNTLSNAFGFTDSKNSGYLDAGANIDLVKNLVLNLHVGHQTVRHNSAFSYTDYKVGVTYDFGVVTASLAAYRANTDLYVGRDGKNLGKSGAVLLVSKVF